MKRLLFSYALCLGLISGLPFVLGQSKFPVPPRPADPEITRQAQTKVPRMQRLDPVQLQREARELSDLAQSLPLDIQQVSQGLLPKETIEKLKRVEKLSKHLRQEITP